MISAADREIALRSVALDLAKQTSRLRLQLALLAQAPPTAPESEGVVEALEESALGLSRLVRHLADVVEPASA